MHPSARVGILAGGGRMSPGEPLRASRAAAFRLAPYRDEALREADPAYRRLAQKPVIGPLWRRLLLPLYLSLLAEGWLLDVAAGPAAWIYLIPRATLTHIVDLGVRPAARRRGLGRRLVAQARHAAVSRGHRLLTLEVAYGNRPARALYESEGFLPLTPSLWRGDPAWFGTARPLPLRDLESERGRAALRQATCAWIAGVGLPADALWADGPAWLRVPRGRLWRLGTADDPVGVALSHGPRLRLLLRPPYQPERIVGAIAALRRVLPPATWHVAWAAAGGEQVAAHCFERAGWKRDEAARLFMAAPLGGRA